MEGRDLGQPEASGGLRLQAVRLRSHLLLHDGYCLVSAGLPDLHYSCRDHSGGTIDTLPRQTPRLDRNFQRLLLPSGHLPHDMLH